MAHLREALKWRCALMLAMLAFSFPTLVSDKLHGKTRRHRHCAGWHFSLLEDDARDVMAESVRSGPPSTACFGFPSFLFNMHNNKQGISQQASYPRCTSRTSPRFKTIFLDGVID